MGRGNYLFFQMILLAALHLIFTTHSVYPTEFSDSKNRIEYLLNEIPEIGKKIPLKEEELTKLRSDLENAQKDSIAREKTFKKSVDSLNRESAYLDSMVKKNNTDQKKLSKQRAKIVRDSIALEKKNTNALLKLSKDRVHLDSLINAMKRKKGKLLKERDSINEEYSDTKKVFDNTISQFQRELSTIDKKVAVRAARKSVLSLRKEKLDLDNRIHTMKNKLDSLMKLDRKTRLEEGGEFQKTQNERSKLKKKQTMLEKNADIMQWEKSESQLSLSQRTVLLDSIVNENNSTLVELVRQRKITTKDSTEVHNDFQKTFSEAPRKLKRLNHTITAIQKTEDSCKAEYDKLEPDSIAMTNKYLEDLEKVKQETALKDNLAQKKKKELAKLKERREKIQQYSLSVPDKHAESVEQVHQSIIKLDESIASNQQELDSLRETKRNFEGSLKNEMTLLDNLIEKEERTILSLLSRAGKTKLDKQETEGEIKDSHLLKMEEELDIRQKYLDSISQVAAYKRKENRAREIKKALIAVENIYTLLINDQAKDADTEYTNESKLLKRYMDDADYTDLKNTITRALEKPEPVISEPEITPVIQKPSDTIEQVETEPVEQESPAPYDYETTPPVPPAITTEEKVRSVDNWDATVLINTIPPRAKIYIDGKLIGESNIGEIKVVSGTHEMKLVVNNKTCIRKITFEVGKNRSMLFRVPCGY